MNFRPEKVFLGKHADGSNLRIEEWNYDSRAGYELAGSFMSIFAGVLFVQIISPFLLVLTILGFNGRANILNIIGVVFGSYFLYDAYNGWLVTNFLHILLSEGIFNILIKLNAIAVVLHLILLVFSNLIFNIINKTCDTEDKCKQVFLSIILIVGFVVFIFTDYVLITHPGWVDKNIQECLERNAEPEPIQVEDVTPAYDDGFFHHDPNYDKQWD
jgi:hypothetical protein